MNNMDYTQEWINFLGNRVKDIEKSLPRPERYFTLTVLTAIISGLTGVIGWLGGWLGGLCEWWEKLLGSIFIAIIIVMLCILVVIFYIYWLNKLYVKKNRLEKKKENVLVLIEMILGKRVSPDEIYNEWQKCKKDEFFKEHKEDKEITEWLTKNL